MVKHLWSWFPFSLSTRSSGIHVWPINWCSRMYLDIFVYSQQAVDIWMTLYHGPFHVRLPERIREVLGSPSKSGLPRVYSIPFGTADVPKNLQKQTTSCMLFSTPCETRISVKEIALCGGEGLPKGPGHLRKQHESGIRRREKSPGQRCQLNSHSRCIPIRNGTSYHVAFPVYQCRQWFR